MHKNLYKKTPDLSQYDKEIENALIKLASTFPNKNTLSIIHNNKDNLEQ